MFKREGGAVGGAVGEVVSRLVCLMVGGVVDGAVGRAFVWAAGRGGAESRFTADYVSVLFLIGNKLGYPAGQEGKIYDSSCDVMVMVILLLFLL